LMTIQRYIAAKKIPAPPIQDLGSVRIRLWSDSEIERVRKILPSLRNGRKLRYKKAEK
jgi:hypothetical protein